MSTQNTLLTYTKIQFLKLKIREHQSGQSFGILFAQLKVVINEKQGGLGRWHLAAILE